MSVSKNFRNIIHNDIKDCELAIYDGTSIGNLNFHNNLILKYINVIDGFSDNLRRFTYDDYGVNTKANLNIMRQKLIDFAEKGYENEDSDSSSPKKIYLSFDRARHQLELLCKLFDEDSREIMQKIDEIQNIIESSQDRTDKWEASNELIKWIADQHLYIGITFLSLLLKM